MTACHDQLKRLGIIFRMSPAWGEKLRVTLLFRDSLRELQISQTTDSVEPYAYFFCSACLLGCSPAPCFKPSETVPTISLTGFRWPPTSRPLETEPTISPATPTPRLGSLGQWVAVVVFLLLISD